MEKAYNIKARDGMTISGTLFKQDNNNSLVIFVHGLTGSIIDHHIMTGVEHFYNSGYNVYYYNQYSDEILDGKRPRALSHDLTVTRQSQDLQDIYKNLKDKYDNIYVIGHSLGGLTIAIASLPCQGQALWDPSSTGNIWWKDKYVAKDNRLIRDSYGIILQLNLNLKKDSETYTAEKLKNICSIQRTPTLIIGASQGGGSKNKHYADWYPTSEFKLLEAEHCFTKLGQAKEVAKLTEEYFNKKGK